MADVGDGLEVDNANWRFRGEVGAKFDEHVAKSVPLYHEGHELICRVSDWFVKDGSRAYDLGCSTGALTAKLARRAAKKEKVSVIGVDAEAEMIGRARDRIAEAGLDNVSFLVDDITQVALEPCDLVTSYYTIQFVRPSVRQQLFDKIYQSLQWGGAFLLFEKVRGNDARFQDILTGLYTDYKLDQGFSAEEIIGKSRSLKGVLEPFSTQGNLDLLRRAGFADAITIFKFICFEGFLAIK
jgi:tRNA (cmo5U34)-methyltransferase